MPATDAQETATGDAENYSNLIDSRTAAWRLFVTVLLVTLGNSAMYVVSVVLPAVQTEFGISRAYASLPYTAMMVCLGLGGLWTG